MSIAISIKGQEDNEVPLAVTRRRAKLRDQINNMQKHRHNFERFYSSNMNDAEIADKMTKTGLPMSEDDVAHYRETRDLSAHGKEGEKRVDTLIRLYENVVREQSKKGHGEERIHRYLLNEHGVNYSGSVVRAAMVRLKLIKV